MPPTMLAAFDGGGIFFFLLVIVATIINWLGEQKKKKQAPRAPTQRPGGVPQPQARPVPKTDSEEERLRRFLEALGVPVGTPPPPPPQPRPVQPIPDAPVQERPFMHPIPQMPPQRTVPPRRPVVLPREPVVPRRPVIPTVVEREPEPAESRDPGRLEEAARVVESVSDEFSEMDKGVQLSAMDAIPEARMAPVQVMFDPAKEVERPGAAQAANVRAMLRSPADLRNALILREILGPAPGLQS